MWANAENMAAAGPTRFNNKVGHQRDVHRRSHAAIDTPSLHFPTHNAQLTVILRILSANILPCLSVMAGNFFLLLLLRVLSLLAGGSGAAVGRAQEGVVNPQLWCVAKNNAEDAALQGAVDWACGPGGADCSPIQQGGACYLPSDIGRMASFAFNSYYLTHGLTDDSCYFGNTAALTSLNPSEHPPLLLAVVLVASTEL